MSWVLFIDESGHDRRNAPYQVLAGVAVEDRVLWKLTTELKQLEFSMFGTRLNEAKAKKLLKSQVFKYAAEKTSIEKDKRTKLAHEIIMDGARPSFEKLVALAQTKIAYCESALDICQKFNVNAFASIVPQNAPRLESNYLRKDYSFLFQRFYNFLNGYEEKPMGYLVLDELDKRSSQILLAQVEEYFQTSGRGRQRSKLIIPEPLFVHSDLTKMVQIADIVAYIISWGLKLQKMNEPKRQELSSLANKVKKLRYFSMRGAHNEFGFKVITDLRPKTHQT